MPGKQGPPTGPGVTHLSLILKIERRETKGREGKRTERGRGHGKDGRRKILSLRSHQGILESLKF